VPQNPFGAAKPREAIIAEKLGKTEEEVLKEEVKKEKLHVRQQPLTRSTIGRWHCAQPAGLCMAFLLPHLCATCRTG
jgi:hypothetical protein